MKQMTFVAAMRESIGKRDDQTLLQFAAEIKALSAEDRRWFTDQFKKAGIEIIETST
jgi:hypothetical protein